MHQFPFAFKWLLIWGSFYFNLPSQKENYKHLGIFTVDTIKQAEMTKNKEYVRWTTKFLETKLSGRKLMKRIKTRAVPLVRHSGSFLKWSREELRQMDQRTRNLTMMHKALNQKDDLTDYLTQYEEYIKNSKGRLIIATSDITDNIETNRATRKTRKQKWEKKTTVWIFQTINWHNLREEDINMITKREPLERNWISSNNSTK